MSVDSNLVKCNEAGDVTGDSAIDILQTVLTRSSVGFGIMLKNCEYEWVNEPFLNLTGYEYNEFVGVNCKFLYENDVEYDRARNSLFNSNDSLFGKCETTWIKKNGEKSHVILESKKANEGYVISAIDITQRVIAEAELLKSEMDLQSRYLKSKIILRETVRSLSSTVQFSDPYTYAHQIQVTELVGIMCEELKLDKEDIDGIKTAAMIHDIGKEGIPQGLLSRPFRLNKTEFELMKQHVSIGFEIVKKIPFCQPVAIYIHQHHEKIDGSGYPFGLSADDILLGSQIISICDVFDAISSHRPYRPAKGSEEAWYVLGNTNHYDPELIKCARSAFKRYTPTGRNSIII